MEADETVLDAALRHGYVFPYGCRNGSCGTCKGILLEGRVDYGVFEHKALSAAEIAAGRALFCQATPLADLTVEVQEVSSVKGIVVKILPARVAKIEQLAHDVARVYLKLPGNERLQFLAGQYLDILLPGGRRRSFSIANAPHDDEFIELHIRQIEGGRFTGEIFSNLKEKAILRLQGPLGSFYLREDSDRPIIFAAGGTGFGPIKGIIEHAFALGTSRPMHLYWGARARSDLYLHELARRWTEEHASFTYTPVLSQPMEKDRWQGRRGYVQDAIVHDFPDLSGYDLYASGPPVMVEAVHRAGIGHGLKPENFYADPFEFSKDAPPAQFPRQDVL
jgi:CDP-4-dehydro-6-deoxyglucose reductase